MFIFKSNAKQHHNKYGIIKYMLNRLIFLYLNSNKTINIINTTRFKIAKEILWKPKKTTLQVVLKKR